MLGQRAVRDCASLFRHCRRAAESRSALHGDASVLLETYFRCGYLQQARDSCSWNAELAAFAQNGHPHEVLKTFRAMDLEGCRPDKKSFANALTACSSIGAVQVGKDIHAEIATREDLRRNIVIATALVNMYGKCGCLSEAEAAFEGIPRHDVVSWSAMVAAYAQRGHFKGGMLVCKRMLQDGVVPVHSILICLTSACTALEQVREVHAFAREYGYRLDGVLGGSLVNLYGKVGEMDAAEQLHGEMLCRTVISWTALVTAYAQQGCPVHALRCCTQMDYEGIKLNEVTFINVLGAFCGTDWLRTGRALHCRALETGFEADGVLGTALVNMYGKCGSITDAEKTFKGIQMRDTVAWNALLTAYAQLGHGTKACEHYRKMQAEGLEFDDVTFVSVLDACGDIEDLELGKQVHSCMTEAGLDTDWIVGSSLMNMYAKCGRLDDACKLFGRVTALRGNLLAWNALAAAYAQLGHTKEVIRIVQKLDSEGLKLDETTFLYSFLACGASAEFFLPGRMLHKRFTRSGICGNVVIVYNALINMYGKCGRPEEARLVFDGMKCRDIVSWNTMLAAYSQSDGKQALVLFHLMDLEGVRPDEVTFVSVLAACASSRNLLSESASLHSRAVACGFGESDAVGGLLVNAYGKCGSLPDARAAFDNMSSRLLVSWTAMVASYAQHSHAEAALQVYRGMDLEGLKPSQLTFVSILCACSHSGLLHEGLRYFRCMVDDHNLAPLEEHYKCIADLFARAGQLGLAEELIQSMPYEPDSVSWMTLLGACHIQKDSVRAAAAATKAFCLNPADYQPLVALSNVFSTVSTADL